MTYRERRLEVVASLDKDAHMDRDDALWDSLVERVNGVLAEPQFACILPHIQPELTAPDRPTVNTNAQSTQRL